MFASSVVFFWNIIWKEMTIWKELFHPEKARLNILLYCSNFPFQVLRNSREIINKIWYSAPWNYHTGFFHTNSFASCKDAWTSLSLPHPTFCPSVRAYSRLGEQPSWIVVLCTGCAFTVNARVMGSNPWCVLAMSCEDRHLTMILLPM
jgi:hypothetical protein